MGKKLGVITEKKEDKVKKGKSIPLLFNEKTGVIDNGIDIITSKFIC